MMRVLASFIFFVFVYNQTSGQVDFKKSNLPIIIINTNGNEIYDDVKTSADLKIIYNGLGIENDITDVPTEYNGKIGIEYRGSSSLGFPKFPYGFETRDETGEDNSVSLLGMPKESDWTLNASYNDKSLMRDGLAYILAGDIMDYAPRVRYSEVVVNDEYQGIYLLVEKIKRDKNRVDIAKLEPTDNDGDALTGGYIIKLDKETGSNSGQGWISPFKPYTNAWQNTFFQFDYPKASLITQAQKDYIINFMNKAETSLKSSNYKDPINGYRKYMDVESLIDFIIINELTKNPDAYRLSTFMHKNRDSEGGKLKFGPVWDFNLGFGNVDYCTQGNPEGLVILNFNDVCSDDYWVIHFWWKKFLEDEAFYSQLKMRWKTLRQKEFSENRVNHLIDSISVLLNKAQVRNFQKWPVLGQYVWPNYYIGNTYSEEVNHLKSWIDSRFAYLDKVWEIKIEVGDTTNYTQLLPNPTADLLTISFAKKVPKDLTISLYDTNGSSFVVPIIDLDENQINLDLSNLPTGLFILRMSYPESSSYYKIVKI